MKKSTRRLVTALLCLCLCLALHALSPMKASAEEIISKVLTTTKYTPVALMDVGLSPAGTSTPGVWVGIGEKANGEDGIALYYGNGKNYGNYAWLLQEDQ